MAPLPNGVLDVNGIFLPEKFENIVKDNQKIHGATKLALSDFSDWLSMNQLIFFPEYTDHGINHIQDVLNTAEDLLTEDSFKILTPEDIYVLTSSILLHDCAMHIGKHGLRELINNAMYSSSLFGYPIEKTFKEEWASFEIEVSKYTDNDWLKFFSDGATVKFPDLDSDLTGYQNVLVGEFVRKHHARIAQVISLHGLPTGGDPEILFNKELVHLNELSGFAARSHNISLRDAVDLVKPEHARFTKNTHLTFLMAVLRIADYLQFENKRTPKICFRIKAFCSPISINEWKKQIAVITTHHTHNDDELLFVDATPEDAITLDGISKLLSGLQKELDALWAVLGEIYSRFKEKKNLGINIRRVRSSIDDPMEYVTRHYKSFHPYLLGLTTNDERLYPLLAGPLYGDRPLIGLRELIQNSIDACNERFTLESKKDPISEEVSYGIKIDIDLPNKTLTISDNGMGMNEEVIKNYFLKIGSSYRYSSSWQETYSKDGDAIVPRTGRFGIGVLAGFLLGDKITIHTKKYDTTEDKALIFEITPSSQKIQINHKRKDTTGTCITINLNETALNAFVKQTKKELHDHVYRGYGKNTVEETEWRWYYLDSPKIEINIIDEKPITLPNSKSIAKTELGKSWKNIDTKTSLKCYWRSTFQQPYVYCNGILIPGIKSPEINIKSIISSTSFLPYEIMFIDNNAALPLNLQRNGFSTEKFFFEQEIKRRILEEYIKSCIEHLKGFANEIKSIKHYYNSDYELTFPSDSLFAVTANCATPLFPGFTFDPEQYYIVDYTKDSLYRGLSYSKTNIVFDNEYGYISVANVEKQATEIREALIFLTNGDPVQYNHFLRYPSAPAHKRYFKGWHFIKKFDFQKLDESDQKTLHENGFTTTEISKEWTAICIGTQNREIPEKISDLFESKIDLKCYMFSLIQIHDNHLDTSEIYEIWEDLKLPKSLNLDNNFDFDMPNT